VPDVGVPVVEDAAQAIGAAQLRGTAGCLSFFPAKNLGGFGDGGAVYTNDHALADRVTLLRTHGSRAKYDHPIVGGNFRLDALQAALLSVKLPHLPAWTAARRARAATYRTMLEAARLPADVVVPADAPGHVYGELCVLVPRRDELRAYLTQHGIETAVYYPLPLHLQPCFEQLGYRRGAFPVTEMVASRILALPIHPALTSAQQEYVVTTIAAFYRTT
jgi:dTDP-4-amino-4,6-dideoxygalactose transaminase